MYESPYESGTTERHSATYRYKYNVILVIGVFSGRFLYAVDCSSIDGHLSQANKRYKKMNFFREAPQALQSFIMTSTRVLLLFVLFVASLRVRAMPHGMSPFPCLGRH